jgi:hypothetical protein
LLRLTEDPRNAANVTPYYLGWDRSGNAGIGGVGIHHPAGDIKKISPYTMVPHSTAYLSNTVNANEHRWRVIWSSGTTEGGSSGSPLINNNHRVIGQLHGGYASCSAQSQPDWYGKFSTSWTGNGATDNRRRLRDWLDPNNTGVSVLNGIGTSSPCVNAFMNQTVSASTTITGCNTLSLQNVTVTSNATLTLDAPGDVIINATFDLQSGSSLHVQ